MTLTYNLDPGDAWLRAHEYRKSKGEFQNIQRMLDPVSPVDLMDNSLDEQFGDHNRSLWWNAIFPRKESSC